MIDYFRKRECRKVRGLLSGYLNGSLSQSDMERVGCHLSRCEECLAEFRSLKETVELLHRLPSEIASPPFFISQADRRIPAPKRWMRKLSIPASIILVLALGTWAILLSFGGESTDDSFRLEKSPPVGMLTEGSILHPENKETSSPPKVLPTALTEERTESTSAIKELTTKEKSSLHKSGLEESNSGLPFTWEIRLGNCALGFGYVASREGLVAQEPPQRVVDALIACLKQICPCFPIQALPEEGTLVHDQSGHLPIIKERR
jgi:hypothetical protein